MYICFGDNGRHHANVEQYDCAELRLCGPLVNIGGCMIKPARPYVHILSLSAYSPGK
jgi:hypothetical protein